MALARDLGRIKTDEAWTFGQHLFQGMA
jgi:hypothetical protein